MGFYDDKKTALQYIAMAEGYDGRELVEVLRLTDEELTASLCRQKEILSVPGLIMHSFWRGAGIEEHHGLKFVYQTEDRIRSIVCKLFSVIDVVVYKEMEEDDSLYVLAAV